MEKTFFPQTVELIYISVSKTDVKEGPGRYYVNLLKIFKALQLVGISFQYYKISTLVKVDKLFEGI